MFCTDVFMFNYDTDKKKENIWCICKKCNDAFKLSYDRPSSCRIHNGTKKCTDCYKTLPCNSHCYHIRRSWWDFFFKWCS